MAGFKIEDFFNYKNITPGSLTSDNVIQFSYKSPAGVHDLKPLVFVLEKKSDRLYGINFHYDMTELQNAVTNTQAKVAKFLEEQYFKKYPENRQKLREQRVPFNKSLITEAELKEFMRRFPKKDMEQFPLTNANKYPNHALRCYLYQRMTAVSMLTWKVI